MNPCTTGRSWGTIARVTPADALFDRSIHAQTDRLAGEALVRNPLVVHCLKKRIIPRGTADCGTSVLETNASGDCTLPVDLQVA